MIRYLFILTFLLSARYTFAQDDATVIKAARMASNAAIVAHDIDGMSKYWLPNFIQTIGRGTSLTGKDTIIASWKALFKTNTTVSYERKPNSIEVGDNGIMAWETGIWVAKNSYSKGGNYSAMWRKIDGTWKLQAELFVSLKQ
ncbi:MAG TPA: nuclear transport factor 2 family protein [Mucilaginibacter sp.]|jgi:ketosteroid isomerase-like protein